MLQKKIVLITTGRLIKSTFLKNVVFSLYKFKLIENIQWKIEVSIQKKIKISYSYLFYNMNSICFIYIYTLRYIITHIYYIYIYIIHAVPCIIFKA